jgi:hypothetical protein
MINFTPPGTEGARPTLDASVLMPRRNPGLIARIADAIFRSQPTTGPQPEDQETSGTGVVSEGLVSLYDRQFKFDVTRRATYKDVEEIDQASEEASVALDTIANNVCTSEDGVQMSFQVMAKDSKAQAVFDKVIQTSKLHQKIQYIVRNLVKYGDFFGEVVVNAALEIVNIKPLPPITVFRNENLAGHLLVGEPRYDKKSGKVQNGSEECAFEQKAESTGNLIATFWPWQILHIRLNHDGFSPYGRSHLRVARVTYKKLKAIEEGLIVGRLTREYQKLIFYVDTTGLSKKEASVALTEFQQNVVQRVHVDGRRENPFSVMTDFFLTTGWIKIGTQVQPRKTSIDIIDPKNVGIHDITDVEYLHRKFLAALRVPPAHMGFEKDVNAKATLTIQDVQYVRMLRNIQQLVGHGLEQVFDTALVLAGMDPEQVDYEIAWPALVATDQMNSAQAELWRAQKFQLYSTVMHVVDDMWIQQHEFNMTDEEIKEVNERIAVQQQQQQAQAAQDAQMDTNRQVDLIKAKAQVGGFQRKAEDKTVQGRVNRHSPGEDDVPAQGNPNKDIGAESKILARILAGNVTDLVTEDLSRVLKSLSLNGTSHD